jgi:aminodeoxyfutalosine synthase
MLYGHVETLADRVDHLRQLAQLAGRDARVRRFRSAALSAGEQRNSGETPPTGLIRLRTIAVSRIYLDNFDHITAYWVGLG